MTTKQIQLVRDYIPIYGDRSREWREFWKDYPEQLKVADWHDRQFQWRVMHP